MKPRRIRNYVKPQRRPSLVLRLPGRPLSRTDMDRIKRDFYRKVSQPVMVLPSPPRATWRDRIRGWSA